jgi:hypothetical protein
VATFVDVFGGGGALRAVHPDWIATGDLSLQTLHPMTNGNLRASGRILRAGRRTVVLEVELRDATERLEPSLTEPSFESWPTSAARKISQKSPPAHRVSPFIFAWGTGRSLATSGMRR